MKKPYDQDYVVNCPLKISDLHELLGCSIDGGLRYHLKSILKEAIRKEELFQKRRGEATSCPICRGTTGHKMDCPNGRGQRE